MAKQEEQNLGVFIMKHPSGMLETDKGEKSYAGNLGDTFMRGEDGVTYIVAKGTAAVKETKAEEKARLKGEAQLTTLTEEVRLLNEAKTTLAEEVRLLNEAKTTLAEEALALADAGVLTGTGEAE